MPPAERRRYERARAELRRDELPCAICGLPIDYRLRAPHPAAFTADHVLPLGLGGSSERENLRPAHLGCNSARGKGDRTPRTKGDRSAWW